MEIQRLVKMSRVAIPAGDVSSLIRSVLVVVVTLVIVVVRASDNALGTNPAQQSLDEDAELCSRAVDEVPFSVNGSSNTEANIGVHHQFLKTDKGLVPGVEYEVSVSVSSTESSVSRALLTTTQNGGRFVGPSSSATGCFNQTRILFAPPRDGQTFTTTFVTNEGNTSAVTLSVSLYSEQNKKWSILTSKTILLRTTCLRTMRATDATLTTEDFPPQSDECKQVHLFIVSPHGTEPELTFQVVVSSGKGWVTVQNVTESEPGVNFGGTAAADGSDSGLSLTPVSSRSGFLLVGLSRCQECVLKASLTTVSTAIGCNSTLVSRKGTIRLWGIGSGVCGSSIIAPTNHKIIVHFVSLSDRSQKCTDFAVSLEQLQNYPGALVWSSCQNYRANTSSFVSKTNSLNFSWNASAAARFDGQFVINYVMVPPCAKQKFGETGSGTFCNSGYPFAFLECETSYSINVPFGYTVELAFTFLELSSKKNSAFCESDYVEVFTKNSSPLQGSLARLCGNWTTASEELLVFRSSSNFMAVKISSSGGTTAGGFCASYRAVPNDDNLTQACEYGWTPGDKYCYRVSDESLNWTQAQKTCRLGDGDLVSVTSLDISDLVEDLVTSSSSYKPNQAYWIGANDMTYENYFEWSDGQTFGYSNWFQGWENFGGYGAQPSDDGLSHQNCVELRNVFRYPSKGEGIAERLYWNDRDCDVANPFVCQKIKLGMSPEHGDPAPFCNRTFTLSPDRPQDVVTSPNFPSSYPNNLECYYDVIAPRGQQLILTFTDFVLEESSSCEYDYLTIEEVTEKPSKDHRKKVKTTWKRCGDWESRIKLLRYIASSLHVRLILTSDFSHPYSGFRAEAKLVGLEEPVKNSLCDNERFDHRGDFCYLMVSYPETSWTTARRICSESRAQLATIESTKELALLHDLVRSTYGYMSGVIFWVGATTDPSGLSWKWLDGRPLNPQKIRTIKTSDPEAARSRSCLALQWRQLRSSSSIHWSAKNCNHSGRFICKKPAIVVPRNLNRTVVDKAGNLTSVNYPSSYVNDLHYTVKIQGPPGARIVMTFHHLDLEWQENCLYDYVLLQNNPEDEGARFCGDHDRLNERAEFESSSNVAYLTFHSDFSITATGYHVSFEMLDLSFCNSGHLVISRPQSMTSFRYPQSYLQGIDCETSFSSSDPDSRLLITVFDFDLLDEHCFNDYLEVYLEPPPSNKKFKFCDKNVRPGTQLLTYGSKATVLFHSQQIMQFQDSSSRGYNLTVEPWDQSSLESVLHLNGTGSIKSLNHPLPAPSGMNHTQRLLAPLGSRIHLRSPNMTGWSTQSAVFRCFDGGLMLWDPYGTLFNRTILWNPCQPQSVPEESVWSTLHVLYVLFSPKENVQQQFSIDYKVVKDDHYLNRSMAVFATSDLVDSCSPHPCLHGGRCQRHGKKFKCLCSGHYTGLFCHFSWCDINVCGENGMCNLTSSDYSCECLTGFTGAHCQQVATPCLPNPCEPNGQCTIQNDTFTCFCDIWYEGTRCEKYVFRIPYKPLSQRMLEEPFWLGLITVFTVLIIILFVYCIKRKFADKIEKFLADEIERSKFQPSPPATRYSLSSNQPSLTPGSQSPQTNPKSLLSRIRRNSIFSSACTPTATPEKDNAKPFSFDDILRRVHSSKKRPGSGRSCLSGGSSNGAAAASGGGSCKEESALKEEEKSRILSSLVSSSSSSKDAARRMSLDEFFRMSERKMQQRKDDASEGASCSARETSFINVFSPNKKNRFSAASFGEIHSIREQSVEYMSSSDSLSGEPSTSEIQVDVLPNPMLYVDEFDVKSEQLYEQEEASSAENSESQTPTSPRTPSPPAISTACSITPPPSILVDNCDRHNQSTEEQKPNDSTSEGPTDNGSQSPSPCPKRKSSYLEVPQRIPSIQVLSADAELEDAPPVLSLSLPKQDRSSHSSNCKTDFVQPRKYSVDLPLPKILITANMSPCDSDEASPPRTPNPVKSMMYLSPLAVISSSADRTISESNLSTSGYSSISSPGLSRCNSSSPISDDVEQHHHSNCNKKTDSQSPKKTQHGLQMAQMAYLAVGGDKTFYFPPTIACHCQELQGQGVATSQAPVFLNTKTSATPTVWRPPTSRQSYEKNRLLAKRNSYQTTSTDDSIDDEGIGMDTIDFKIRKGEVRSARDLEIYFAAENQDDLLPQAPNSPSTDSTASVELNKPDLLACSINKSASASSFKNSPRSAIRKSDKAKKYSEKYRRSPSASPSSSSPVKDIVDNAESRIPRNSSRTSISLKMSSSESDDPESFVGSRTTKSQTRRPKKPHDPSATGSSKQMYGEHQDIEGRISDVTSRSESNGDSAPMDSRSPNSSSSSSESPPSARDSNEYKESGNEQLSPPTSEMDVSALCTRHRLALEHASSFPPPKQSESHEFRSQNDVRTYQLGKGEERRPVTLSTTISTETTISIAQSICSSDDTESKESNFQGSSGVASCVQIVSVDSMESSVPSDSEEEQSSQWKKRNKERDYRPLIKVAEDGNIHPPLKRQEAIAEDEISDDSSSETTVLLRRPPGGGGGGGGSPSERSSLFLHLRDNNNSSSQSADISEWETTGLFQADSPKSPGEGKNDNLDI